MVVLRMLTSEPEEGKCSVSCRKRTCLFFECFPYVCPEPVLVKRYMFSIKWHRKKTRFPPPHRVAVKFETGVQAHVREVVLRPGGCRDRPVDADAHVYDTQYSTYTRDQMAATAAAAAAAAAVVSDSSNERFSGDTIRGGADGRGGRGRPDSHAGTYMACLRRRCLCVSCRSSRPSSASIRSHRRCRLGAARTKCRGSLLRRQGRASLQEDGLCLSAFPMFVPSLSW